MRASLILVAAGVALAGGGACGSGSQPSSQVTGQVKGAAGGSLERSETTRGPAGLAAPASTILDDSFFPPPLVESRSPPPLLCQRDPVAFDLSLLGPSEGTPARFAEAWSTARQRSSVPGFVVAFSGTASGPNIEARVGAVYSVAAGLYAFETVLPPSDIETVLPNPSDPFYMRSVHDSREFVTAFGAEREREGFVISKIIVEGRLDASCEFFRDVRVQLTLPHANMRQPFGGTTIDEAMGDMNADSDQDGAPDSWTVTMTASSLANLMFRL